MNLAKVREMLKRNEGVRTFVYKDSLGIETIGVGFNLLRPGARFRCIKYKLDYDALLSGAQALTLPAIDALLNDDIDACVESLRSFICTFDALPEPAQHVLIDMRFQLGEAGLRAFKHMLRAVRVGEWKNVATEMRDSRAYQQTSVRWERNAKAMEKLA